MYLGARVSRAINQEQKKHTALNEQNKQKAAGHLEIVHKAPLKCEISKSKKKSLLPVQLENFHRDHNYTSDGLRTNKHSRN